MNKNNTIAVIDYDMSNMFSIKNALKNLNFKPIVTSNYDTILSCDGAVLPGVGSFPEAMKNLKKLNLDNAIIDFIASGKPFLGICLGLQMLFETSEEGGVNGFGLLPGAVKRFQLNENERIKIPHMGWNKVHLSNTHPMWNKIDSDSRFYFVHSFYAEVTNKSLEMATSSHGEKFTCAIAKDNIFAVQFHPEKSSQLGLQLLKNFISWNI